jgi:hypothetical protein
LYVLSITKCSDKWLARLVQLQTNLLSFFTLRGVTHLVKQNQSKGLT